MQRAAHGTIVRRTGREAFIRKAYALLPTQPPPLLRHSIPHGRGSAPRHVDCAACNLDHVLPRRCAQLCVFVGRKRHLASSAKSSLVDATVALLLSYLYSIQSTGNVLLAGAGISGTKYGTGADQTKARGLLSPSVSKSVAHVYCSFSTRSSLLATCSGTCSAPSTRTRARGPHSTASQTGRPSPRRPPNHPPRSALRGPPKWGAMAQFSSLLLC